MNTFKSIRMITRAMQKQNWDFRFGNQIRTFKEGNRDFDCPLTFASYYYTNKCFPPMWFCAAGEEMNFPEDLCRDIGFAADFPNQMTEKRKQIRKILLRAARLTEKGT